jgi:hypothetical protein
LIPLRSINRLCGGLGLRGLTDKDLHYRFFDFNWLVLDFSRRKAETTYYRYLSSCGPGVDKKKNSRIFPHRFDIGCDAESTHENAGQVSLSGFFE